MSISVLSGASAKISPTAPPAGSTASSATFGDFSALLSGQTLVAETNALAPPFTETIKTESTGDETGASGTEALDPSILAAMLGLAPAAPATNAAQISTNSSGNDKASSKEGIEAVSGKLLPKEASTGLAPNNAASGVPAQQIDTERQSSEQLFGAANIAAESDPLPSFTNNLESAIRNTSSTQEIVRQPQTSITAHLSSPTWPDQFSEKIVWLAKNDQQSAQININPPQLGPLQITLNLNGDQASAVFASPHPEVRQAIEAAMPQLREMLSSAGISLGDANVGSNLAQQNASNPFQNSNGTPSRDENAILPANENASGTLINKSLRSGRGLVDLFA